MEPWEPFSHMSKGRAYSSTEPGLSTQLVLRTCPGMSLQFIKDPGAGETSRLTEQNFLSFVIAQVPLTQPQMVAREALGGELLGVGA